MPLNQPRWRECPERSSRAPPDGQEAINPMQKNGENDLHHINIIRGDLTLENGPILVPVKEVESLIDNDDHYPSWPASKYQGILDRLKELAQEYEEWLVKDQRSQRQNKMWHQGSHPRDFSGHFSNQRRHNNELPRFRSAFDQNDFEREFLGQRQRRQPNFYDLFW